MLQPISNRFAAAALVVAMIAACNTPAGLKEDARELREDVERCSDGDECVLISVDSDCTGLLGCPFPVRAARKTYAEARAKEIAEASRGLSECTMASCAGGLSARCDTAQSKCVRVTQDGGTL